MGQKGKGICEGMKYAFHKHVAPIGICIGILILLSAGIGVVSASPSIASWSSTGGHPVNKDSPHDLMYLAQQGDTTTFSVNASESVTYNWYVNKIEQENNQNTFTWTVPNKKGIWEIHLKVSNAGGEDHREWVVSTLSLEEAPDIFDYFTDGKLTQRTETDPWGRLMKNWTAWDVTPEGNYEASKGYMTSSRTSGSLSPYDIYLPNTIKYGTWKFRVYYTSDTAPSGGYGFCLKADDSINKNSFRYRAAIEPDTHKYVIWCSSTSPAIEKRISVRVDGDAGYSDPNPVSWHDYTVILTQDGWFYEFVDGILGHIWYIENPDEPFGAVSQETPPIYYTHQPMSNDKGFSLGHLRTEQPAFLDNIEIYENEYLFPNQSILYGEFIDYWADSEGSGPRSINTSAIIIRKLNTSLADIDQAINDPSKFTYNPTTRTAISYVNITIGDAHGIGELVLNNETLKFHGTSDGSLMLSVYHGSILKIASSTIDSDNNYYWKWRITNIGDTTGYPVGLLKDKVTSWGGPTCVFLGAIEITDSTINNSANFFISSPHRLKIKDTQILNLHADYTGIYNYTGYFPLSIRDRKAHWNFPKTFAWEQNFYHVLGFEFNNVTCSIAADSLSNDIVLTQNDELLQKLNLYNLDLSNANIKVMKTIKMFSGTTSTAYYKGRTALVNSRWNSVSIVDDNSEFVPKYYLDVKVVNSSGGPVQGASVDMVNEVDDEHYPAENITEPRWFFDSLIKDNSPDYWWQSSHLHPASNIVVYNYNDGHIRYSENTYMPRVDIIATTDADGHTPLPTFPSSNSLVIADYVKNQTDQINFIYNITASKNGQTASISGLDVDESWYRENPNTPVKTVVCNIDTGECKVENVATGANSPTTTATIIPAPDESDWNNVTPVVVTFFRSDNDSNISYTNYSKTSETGPWTTVDISAATGPDAGNVTDISEGGFNVTVSDEGTTEIWFYSVDTNSNIEPIKNITVKIDTTQPIKNVIIQSPNDVTDNRLRASTPDVVLGSTDFIDVGTIGGIGNYRDVIWFNLSGFNSTDTIKSAKLSLFWYYESRDKSTTVEIYRPVDWAEGYVNWNNRTNGVAWDNPGGDWYDTNNEAQGNTPYAAVTFPVGAPDNAYHEFDVTELVQSYVNDTFDNAGFFIKANEVSDSYIAFRSSDYENANERPKLVVSYSSGDAQQNTLTGTVTTPDSTGIAGANVTLTTPEGTVINTTQTDISGNYTFTDVSAGTYSLTVTKPRFWPANNNITVTTTGNTENVMLWLKGDLNLNGAQADSGDLLMMDYAATGALTPDWKFDLNGNGDLADAGDVLMLEEAAAGKIELL